MKNITSTQYVADKIWIKTDKVHSLGDAINSNMEWHSRYYFQYLNRQIADLQDSTHIALSRDSKWINLSHPFMPGGFKTLI